MESLFAVVQQWFLPAAFGWRLAVRLWAAH